MTAADISAILTLASVAIPEVAAVVKSVAALRKQYPELTPEQINSVVAAITSQADTAFDDTIQKITADQAGQPKT